MIFSLLLSFAKNFMNKTAVYLVIGLICFSILGVSGCGVGKPRPRLGCYPTSTPGSRFVSANRLGKHSYGFGLSEKNGITYTCKGGHIDIAHLRIGADNTRYIANKLYKGLLKGRTEFSFGLAADKSKHIIKITYPKNWEKSEKEPIAKEVSLRLGQYIAFTETSWHEMLTWFGYRTMAVFTEYPSAFSWEDTYSNLLGTRLAVEALRDTQHNYNQALTLALEREMKKLGSKSARQAIKAARKVRGEWFTGNLFVSMKKRNIDIGLDDKYVTPMIVAGVCPGQRPQSYPVPQADVRQYGFSMEYQIVPREFEKGKILRIVYPNGKGKTIQPDIHFAKIMDHIEKTAIEKYGTDSVVAYNPDRVKYPKRIQLTAAAPKTTRRPAKIATIRKPVRKVAVSDKNKPKVVKNVTVSDKKKREPVRVAKMMNTKIAVAESLHSLLETIESHRK